MYLYWSGRAACRRKDTYLIQNHKQLQPRLDNRLLKNASTVEPTAASNTVDPPFSFLAAVWTGLCIPVPSYSLAQARSHIFCMPDGWRLLCLLFPSGSSVFARCDGRRILAAGREWCMYWPLIVNMGHEFRVNSYWPRSIYRSVNFSQVMNSLGAQLTAWRASLTAHSNFPFEGRKSHCAWRTVWDWEVSWI